MSNGYSGMLDRSPCGSGTCAIMALLHARGELDLGERFVHAVRRGFGFYRGARGRDGRGRRARDHGERLDHARAEVVVDPSASRFPRGFGWGMSGGCCLFCLFVCGFIYPLPGRPDAWERLVSLVRGRRFGDASYKSCPADDAPPALHGDAGFVDGSTQMIATPERSSALLHEFEYGVTHASVPWRALPGTPCSVNRASMRTPTAPGGEKNTPSRLCSYPSSRVHPGCDCPTGDPRIES